MVYHDSRLQGMLGLQRLLWLPAVPAVRNIISCGTRPAPGNQLSPLNPIRNGMRIHMHISGWNLYEYFWKFSSSRQTNITHEFDDIYVITGSLSSHDLDHMSVISSKARVRTCTASGYSMAPCWCWSHSMLSRQLQ